MPADANDLDAMFRQNDMGRLAARLRGTHAGREVALDMNWEQAKLYNGAGFIIAYAYMFDLWRVGSSLPGKIGDGLKDSAGMMFLYSLDLIMLDGLKCADASAPAHRRDQLFTQSRPIIAYTRTLPRATRMALGMISLEIEAATATVRMDDDVLCSGGLDETKARLKANGSKPLQEAPTASGTFEKTYALPPAPHYKPQFVAANVWQPKQAAARKALPAYLTRFLTLPSDAPSAPSDNRGKPPK